MPTARLANRTVIQVAGPDAEHFLQNIVTTDLDKLHEGEARPGALLSPQGKILFDFLISRAGGDALLLDTRADAADDFLRRLTLYKLRAKLDISQQDQMLVSASWQEESDDSETDSTASQTDSTWLRDTRFPPEARVTRCYGAALPADATMTDWDVLRVRHGIAESGADYALGDAFPHDVLLDQTGGVGFRKGCYVGQEVVSRMQHRGTARRRVMIARGEAALPPSGTEVQANGRAIGAIAGGIGRHGLAVMRIDRVKDALDAGHAVTAEGVPLTLSIPDWAGYALPQDAGPEGG